MAKERLSPRMAITIPGDLREQMDKVGADVNWSRVAAKAFRAELLRIKSRTGVTSREDVVRRMRAAAELEANESFNRGRAFGETWAKTKATPRALRRLASWNAEENSSNGVEIYYVVSGVDAKFRRRSTVRTAYKYWARYFGRREDAVEMMNFDENGKTDGEQSDLARGFVAGALELWEAVKGELD